MNKLIKIWLLSSLLLMPSIIYSFSKNESVLLATYTRIIKANHFNFYPKIKYSNNKKDCQGSLACSNWHLIIFKAVSKHHVQNQDELAFVLGHELAHYKLWHLKSNYYNEYQADKYGVKYMKAAGFNHCKGVQILKRFGPVSKTHPAGIDRYNQVKCRL